MTPRLGMSLHAVGVRRGEKWVLRDITLQLKPGERWALVGGNGAGKTQLLKLLSTAVWPTPTRSGRRSYRLGRRAADLLDAKERIAYIGAELQDKYARYGWNLAVADLVATGLHRTDLLLRAVTAAERMQVGDALAQCGLIPLARRDFLSLSYGQKRLALLARALVGKPDWLLLDEFYNGLDADYRQRIDEILGAARVRGQSWMAAAHRAMDVPRGTSRLLTLDRGRVVSSARLRNGDLERLASRAHATQATVTSVAAASAPRRPRSRVRPLIRIAAADLFVEYQPVLRDMNWELLPGQQWAVFGANGAGKSSFLKMLYGDLSPALGGRIERRGFPKGTPIAAWKKHVGFVSPELQTDYAVDVTVLDLVASGRHASIGLVEALTPQDRRVAERLLRFFALTALARRRPRELSYGQLRRALIARALAGRARILLLDEPLTGLDPQQRAVMKRHLGRLMAQGVSLVIAVHHAEDLPHGMTHALRLHNHTVTARDFDSAT